MLSLEVSPMVLLLSKVYLLRSTCKEDRQFYIDFYF